MREEVSPLLPVQVSAAGVKQIGGMLRWEHQRGAPAHCLLRLCTWPLYERTVAVFSELMSNDRRYALPHDFPGAARAARRLFSADLERNLEGVVWIVHEGKFSDYDALNREAFSRVSLHWTGDIARCDLSDWHLLNDAEATALFEGADLQPVQAALALLQKPA